MKRVSIIGLGWLGMPLALRLQARGYQVVGSKTSQDGVEAARMSGIECYQLNLLPEPECSAEDLPLLLDVDVLIITLPARRSGPGSESYFDAVRMLVDSALAYGVPRIIFTSSSSVYGDTSGLLREDALLQPNTPTGRVLVALEQWLHALPNTSVDILRLSGLVGGTRHPGRFLAGKTSVPGGALGVNLVHQDDVIAAIQLLLQTPKGGHLYNLCAPLHPSKREFYPAQAVRLQLTPPQFAADPAEPEAARLVDGNRICQELGFEYQYPDPARMPMG